MKARSDRFRRSAVALSVAIIVALVQSGRAPAQQIVRTEDAIVAIFSLQTQIDVERKLLARSESQYDSNLRRRAEVRDRLSRLHDELETLFKLEKGETPDAGRTNQERPPSEAEIRQSADSKETEVVSIERAETAAQEEGRRLRSEIRQTRMRIALLTRQMESLKATQPGDRESVTGIWDISLLPSGDHGVFALWQSGTIVSGQYVLDGPFRGSLEGTLVNRQILLRRIDARLGRSMEFSGYLSADGAAVQGTWLNYDLSSGRSPSGSWSGRKRASAPSETIPQAGEQGP